MLRSSPTGSVGPNRGQSNQTCTATSSPNPAPVANRGSFRRRTIIARCCNVARQLAPMVWIRMQRRWAEAGRHLVPSGLAVAAGLVFVVSTGLVTGWGEWYSGDLAYRRQTEA